MSPSKPKALLRSLLISYLLSGILLLVMSFALYKLKLKEAQINTAVYAVYVIACLVGGILSGKALQNRRFFWGLLTAVFPGAVCRLVADETGYSTRYLAYLHSPGMLRSRRHGRRYGQLRGGSSASFSSSSLRI